MPRMSRASSSWVSTRVASARREARTANGAVRIGHAA
jgi:hypothetical protein